jgi:hypothetical protein
MSYYSPITTHRTTQARGCLPQGESMATVPVIQKVRVYIPRATTEEDMIQRTNTDAQAIAIGMAVRAEPTGKDKSLIG